MKYSQLLVVHLKGLLGSRGEDMVMQSQIDIALGIKKDFETQSELATTSAQCEIILSALPKNAYDLVKKVAEKRDTLREQEFSAELAKLPDTSTAYSEVLNKYPRQTLGYEKALEKKYALLSQELAVELEKADTPKKCKVIAEKAPYHGKIRQQTEAKGNALLLDELSKATSRRECERIEREASFFANEAYEKAGKKIIVFRCRELVRKLKRANTPEACMKVVEEAPKESAVRKMGLEKYQKLLSNICLRELRSVKTSDACAKIRNKAPGWSEGRKQAEAKYARLLLQELVPVTRLSDCLVILDKAEKRSEVRKKIWQRTLELFTVPQQLMECLQRVEPHSPEAYAAIKKAADMLLSQQEAIAV